MKIQDVREIIRLIDNSSIDEFKFEQEGTKLSIKKNRTTPGLTTTAPPISVIQNEVPVKPEQKFEEVKEAPMSKQETPAVNQDNLHKITSPMVGTFYAAPSPDSDLYVKASDKVKEDTVVCIVEAMKLMNEIEAEINGTIVEVLVENGQLVEYGQPLFLVQPE
ncbi:acetyl-CoA carboxylase biotin carboxyl carrier protein [Bacillus sp. FJAT-45350]|uniref:acetyl-CoA carboxylase biotin carboxyl carrier protein n=1 Tax=Bacillus sp. FJAT-45350 TaxID=2011014 RepID=UPI000BB90F6E|nr:acetyl-CoA carboxylase biotin carboxyl carrier protein [Bacillus sp. FJAT-45350]